MDLRTALAEVPCILPRYADVAGLGVGGRELVDGNVLVDAEGGRL